MWRRCRTVALLLASASIAVLGIVTPIRSMLRTRSGEVSRPQTYLSVLESAAGRISEPVIGYVADQPIDVTRGGRDEALYYLAQYALAPVVVDPRPTGELRLANFSRSATLQQLLARPEVEMVLTLSPGQAIVRVRGR